MNTVQQPSESQKLWQKTQHRGLIRYIPSGTFYARLRVKGKLLVRSLQTDVLTVAKLRLSDLEKAERKRAERVSGSGSVGMTFGDALEIFRSLNFRPIKARSAKDKINLKPGTISYYEQRVVALNKSWPQLIKLPCSKVTASDCAEWAARFASEHSASAYNHTLGLMRHVFDIAISRGAIYENPASGLIRAAEKPKKSTLPSGEQFRQFVSAIETSGSGHSKPCANLVRFLAYGGFRKQEAAYITWADCLFNEGRIIVRGNPETGTKGAGDPRFVPMIPEMRKLLESLRAARPDEPATAYVMEVRECQKAMDSASKKVGMQRITHHDLRDLFTTRAIESGVDIATVARWLGHKDGGALLMRTYAHLRDQHSTEMAAKVSF